MRNKRLYSFASIYKNQLYRKQLVTCNFIQMHKPLLYLLVSLTLFSCQSKSQNTIDKVKSQELFKETIPIFASFLRLQHKNDDSAKILSNILIEKYKIIYQSDTTSKSIGDFLSDCYKFNKEYEKQIFWDRHQLSLDNKPLDKKVYFENLANAFLSLGIADSSKLYFEKAFNLEKELDYQIQIVADFKSFADNIYLKQDKEKLEILGKRVISTCQYSVDILKLLLPYINDNKVYLTKPFSLDTIIDREKNCR